MPIPQSFRIYLIIMQLIPIAQNIKVDITGYSRGRQRSWLDADHHCQSLGGHLCSYSKFS